MSEDGIHRDGFQSGDGVVITGGGGGFGRAFAKRFARAGGRIAVWEINAKEGEETARQVREIGGEAQFFHVDLSKADEIAAAGKATLAAFGAPYCVINNASVFPRGEILELTLEQWELTFRVNVTGAFLVVRALGPAMIEQKRGCIINVASGRALEATPSGGNYGASKAALHNFTKTLAWEWAKHRIRVNTLIPGQSLTAMPMVATPEDVLIEKAKTEIPLGRIGYPEDMAGLAMFLASSDAAWMTGQGVAMNGGAVLAP